ncbi:Blue-light photoreceptor PHR2 [Acorus calamus]|uniref:Blue-light photoreceptor PHR2 n=1 Tax=Acorus calamus TaxID=4465 RepID=A0AAV9E0Y0_ACOCL|nr:Blue-light photoreceptor PHR2 [Acorus calamus]
MSLLIFPRIRPIPLSLPSLQKRRRFFVPAAAVAAERGAAVVWFKQDLRIDDHPGLVAASRHRTVVPVYVFDRRILPCFQDEMIELVLSALEDLQKSLRDQGSDLLIRFGSVEDVLLELVNKAKATHIYAEEEVEYNILRAIDAVGESLSSMPFSWGTPQLVSWQTPFYDIKNLAELPTSYREFRKLRIPVTTPIASPVLPSFDIELDRDGDFPTINDIKRYLNGNPHKLDESWMSIKEMSAKAILRRDHINQDELSGDIIDGSGKIYSDNNESSQPIKSYPGKQEEKSAFLSREGILVKGGADNVFNALAAYLRDLEGTGRGDWQEVHEKLRMAETREGASFGALFGAAIGLGIISRRRVYFEAIKYERERNAGFLSPFGYSAATVAAAIDTVCSKEWYWLLASKSLKSNEVRHPVRIWRWNGYLIQYTVVGNEGPGVLLVHGFGAFLEHYRDNISDIADGGNRVWAITLLGFGKSEKPNIVYSELVWAELLRDFIIDVVGEPVHLVGNSIGGFFVAGVSGLWPALAKSVVLINTAGSVIPGYSSVQLTEAGQTSGSAWLGARLLLVYLRLSAKNILANCYPTDKGRVDSWLISEIIRASYDPGVLIVLESVFNFNLSIPLNYLFDAFGGRILVIQGTRDPLSNSKVRLSMLKEHCNGVVIKELNAGHCPHDELPEKVNSIIGEWMRVTESSLSRVASFRGSG